ncbi:hypothetical protein C8A05DRAFT_19465, partial [Staphylotrichum tortipilum]
RKLYLSEELPDAPPEGFAALRNKIMGFAGSAEAQASTAPYEDEDLAGLFVIITDEHSFQCTNPQHLQPDLRCADCGAEFGDYLEKVAHRKEAHGAKGRHLRPSR